LKNEEIETILTPLRTGQWR